jgi:hypothetical protein
MIGKSIKALIIILDVLLIVYPSIEYAREATKPFTLRGLHRRGDRGLRHGGAGIR